MSSQAKRVSMTESPKTTASTKSPQTVVGSAPVLAFPSAVSCDTPNLSPLSDKRSAYSSVARTCLQLNQFAGTGSSAAASDTDDDDNTNALFHDASYAKTISSANAALMECAQSHDDRRCRILAAKTLALVARSAYARLRHSPLLFGIREGTLHRLEDEVGTDVPVALCNVALEDVDDGVAACAMEALGILTLCNTGMVGTSVEDVLLREVEAIAHARPSPFAPSLMVLQDDDYSVPQLELQSRVYENVVSPRLWRLVRRILCFGSVSHLTKSLPFLTACQSHLVLHTSSFGMNRSDYAKRWVEIDPSAMVDEIVEECLLPAMQQNEAVLAECAALCCLRLAHACPNATWLPQACPWIVSVLVDQVMACQERQQKMATLATLVISLRALPLAERIKALEFIANEVRFLPSTTRVPSGVVSPGIQSSNDGSYRRPARIGFLSEIAVSFFVDDVNDAENGNNDGSIRSEALKKFLSSSEVTSILSSRSGKKSKKNRLGSNQTVSSVSSGDGLANSLAGGRAPTEDYMGTHVAEEVVLAFCQVASKTGKRVMMPRGGSYRSSRNLEDWLRCSLAVLSAFSSCVNWRSRTIENALNEEDHDTQTLFTVLAAAQASYIGLLQECIYTVGLLSPASSVSLHVMPLAVPPDLTLLEEKAQDTVFLSEFEPVSGVDFAHKDLITLADQFLEYKLREGIASRHTRIFLLALLTDHWVQSSHLATAGGSHDADEPTAIHINELNAREILATLSQEISTLSQEIMEEKEDGKESRNAEANEQYLRVCVACIENMALTACDWTRRFGASNPNLDEDARYVISLSLAALDGKNIRDGDLSKEKGDDGKTGMMTPCVEASRHIHDAARAGDALHADAFGIGGQAPALYSSLVATARLDIKSGMEYSAYMSTSPVALSEAATHHALLTQYCQQVVGSRFDLAISSSCLAVLDDSNNSSSQGRLAPGLDGGPDIVAPNALQTKNALRLAAQPPPPSQLPEIIWSPGERICWNGSTSMVTAGSDPVAVMLTYVARRFPRYDCEPEYRIEVMMKVHNITAVEVTKGIRLGLSVTYKQTASAAENLEDEVDAESEIELLSTSSVYKQALLAGDHLTWEVSLPHLPSAGRITLCPSITFRETEGDQSPPRWVEKNGEKSDGVAENTDEATEYAENLEVDNVIDVSLSCEEIPISSMASLQPDPLVFFRRAHGGESVFRFLWLQLPYRTAPIELVCNDPKADIQLIDELANAVSKLSSVTLQEWLRASEGEVNGWAFLTLAGKRVFCVIASATEEATLQIRTDDEELIQSFSKPSPTLAGIISALTSNRWRLSMPESDSPAAEREAVESEQQPTYVYSM